MTRRDCGAGPTTAMRTSRRCVVEPQFRQRSAPSVTIIVALITATLSTDMPAPRLGGCVCTPMHMHALLKRAPARGVKAAPAMGWASHALAICGIFEKCPSRVRSTRSYCSTKAAIQMSLVGIGVPCLRNCAKRLA